MWWVGAGSLTARSRPFHAQALGRNTIKPLAVLIAQNSDKYFSPATRMPIARGGKTVYGAAYSLTSPKDKCH